MNLTHVLAFHRVASAGGFTRAARISGLSQPTLSAQVRALERTAGLALIERNGRRFALTPDGQRLLTATNRLAEAIEEVEAALGAPRERLRGLLRVSADSAVHVIPVLAELKRRADGFGFTLRIDNSSEVIAHVLEGEADVGVAARAVEDARLHQVEIRTDRLVLQVARAHPWAGKTGGVRLAELAGRELVMRERGSITRALIERRLAEAGIAPGQVFEVETREVVTEAVAAGFGAGIVFASEAGSDPRLAVLPLRGADLAVSEYAICRSDRRRIAHVARFLQTARRLAVANRWLGEARTSDADI